MNFIGNRFFRFFRFGLLTIGLLAIGVNMCMVWSGRSQQAHRTSIAPKQRLSIPAEGLATTPDSKGGVPGNPERTIADMKRLFKEIGIYQQRHSGEYPSIEDGKDIDIDRLKNPREYGYKDGLEAIKSFRNADMKYSDRAHGSAQPEDYFPYVMNGKRPDGTRVGSPKASGTRDVLAYTDIYYHRNIRLYKGNKTTTQPVGFYLVLWDDGEVQKVPYQDVRFAAPQRTGNGGLTQTHYFEGQAGAPTQGTLSRAEYDKWVSEHI